MTESYSDHEFLVLRPEVAVAVIKDGAVLLDLETKYFYSVNSTGWAIIRLFERGTTLEQVRTQCRVWSGGSVGNHDLEVFLATIFKEHLVVAGQTDVSQDPEPPENGWSTPRIEKYSKPLQRIMTSAFDPSIPLAE